MPGEPSCIPRQIQGTPGDISHPLLDRIGLDIEVHAVKFREVTAKRTGETSAETRERLIAAPTPAWAAGS